MKSLDARIAYYTRKVSEYLSIHHTKPRNRYRSDRLLAYKKAMHKRIQEVRM